MVLPRGLAIKSVILPPAWDVGGVGPEAGVLPTSSPRPVAPQSGPRGTSTRAAGLSGRRESPRQSPSAPVTSDITIARQALGLARSARRAVGTSPPPATVAFA